MDYEDVGRYSASHRPTATRARLAAVIVVTLAAGCGGGSAATDAGVNSPDASVGSPDASVNSPDASVGSPDARGASPDAATSCNPTAPFGAPVLLTGFGSPNYDEGGARLLPDELTLYFSSTLGGANTDLYVATRSAIAQPFGSPAQLTTVDVAGHNDYQPTVSSDGLTLIFESDRAVGQGAHLYVSTRASTAAPFGAASLLSGVNSATITDNDVNAFLTADGKELWFVSDRAGGAGKYDIYRATKNAAATFSNPQPVAELNSASNEEDPVVSADGLTVYFSSGRSGGKGSNDIWTSHRTSTADGFPAPTLVPSVNTTANDEPTWLSPDNCRLYLFSNVAGTFDIYVATRQP